MGGQAAGGADVTSRTLGLAALVDDPHLPYPWLPAQPPPNMETLRRVLAGLERFSPRRTG
jgi:hypothetical protein